MSGETNATNAPGRETRTKHPEDPATPAQRGWLASHGVDPNAANDPALTKGGASEWISGIIESGKKNAPAQSQPTPPTRTQQPQAPTPPPAAPPSPEPEFVTADKLPARQVVATQEPETGMSTLEGASPSSFLVTPEVGITQARSLWNNYLAFRDVILSDPACYDEIDGHREMNRTGATRLALPFGLSIEERSIEEGRVELADEGMFDYRYRVRVRVSKGARFVDGIGSCRLSEIPGKLDQSKKEHWALTKAFTRATKRAISDMLGGTGVDEE